MFTIFVDPDGIKELKRDSVEKIVNRKCATDILLNYIKGGVERIVGLAKKDVADVINKGGLEKYVKTLNCLKDFSGLEVFDKLNLTERERLKDWTESINRTIFTIYCLQVGNLLPRK